MQCVMQSNNIPCVDILIASYNGEKYINSLINSILNQTYKNLKIIISDDNSTDRTFEKIKWYKEKYPEKFEIFKNEKNMGPIKNFENLLKTSTSEYIFFCDQDDIWLSDKIEKSVFWLQKIEITDNIKIPALIFSDLYLTDENLKICGKYYKNTKRNPYRLSFSNIFFKNKFIGCTLAFNRKLKNISLPFSDNIIMHDWWISLHALSFGKIFFIDLPLILYRQHANNTIGAQKINYSYDFFKKIILNSLLKINKTVYKNKMKKICFQADSFMKKNKLEISYKNMLFIKKFSYFYRMSFMEKIFFIIRYRLYADNLHENIEFIIKSF